MISAMILKFNIIFIYIPSLTKAQEIKNKPTHCWIIDLQTSHELFYVLISYIHNFYYW